MNVQETKNIVRRKKKVNKLPIIAAIAIVLAAVILTVLLLLPKEEGGVDINREPSRGLSFDKTSIVEETYMLVGVGACKDKDIVVQPSKNDMPVTSVGSMAFQGNQNITSIVFPETLTSIGSSAFAYCNNLKYIIFKGNVTHIGNSAFRYCEALEEITLPSSVNAIAESAFSHCTNLTKIHFGGTMEEWDKIHFGAYWNVYMPEYTVYCTDGEIFVDLYSKYR